LPRDQSQIAHRESNRDESASGMTGWKSIAVSSTEAMNSRSGASKPIAPPGDGVLAAMSRSTNSLSSFWYFESYLHLFLSSGNMQPQLSRSAVKS
jgi:hypothetical protein